MCKHLYFIGGTMGIGKTTACQRLKERLWKSVFLDGDNCWDSHPFTVNEETKAMVIDNICYVLSRFLKSSAYDHVIFCWVLHEQSIIDAILDGICRLVDGNVSWKFHNISLICRKEALIARLSGDIENGLRSSDIIERSTIRLPYYAYLKTHKIDVSDLSAEDTATWIIESPFVTLEGPFPCDHGDQEPSSPGC